MSLGPVAIVTGANAGIGLALCEQLLASHPGLRLCLACRNKQRAESARASLLASFPDAVIDVVIVDTSSVESVLQAAAVLKEKYKHIDFLYLNAGVMQAGGVRWNRILSGIFSRKQIQQAQASNPQASNPQASNPQASNPQASNPQASNPQASNPQASNPQASNPQASNPQASNPQAPIHRPPIPRPPIHRPPIHRPPIHRPPIHRPPIHAPTSSATPAEEAATQGLDC
ncbi:hypothetical protein ACOMHN_048389 [Nucella lapillus]